MASNMHNMGHGGMMPTSAGSGHSDGTSNPGMAGPPPHYGPGPGGLSHHPTAGHPAGGGPGQPPTPQVQQQQQQAAATKELNAAMLCRFGLETVQEIVARSVDLFHLLRNTQPPDGKQNVQMERKQKFQEALKNIKANFKRLRVIYEKIEESFPSNREIHFEEEILSKTDDSSEVDEKKNTEAYKQAVEEYKEVMEHVMIRNRHLKDAIDHLRTMIWDVNTMLAMRKE